jgi:REP element-mobilizing transposase RayT
MPRLLRIEEVGFYHIINRGVERRTVFIEQNDFLTFLNIVNESAKTYNFTIHSFCLMPNHYHLLLQTYEENLSLIMRQINSRYSIYFNNKYKRVGPLWQGRYKSNYVYEENYLSSLVKYIEFNPIKAHITKTIGEYRYSMSSKNFSLSCLNYELIDSIDFSKELEKVDEIFSAKLEVKDNRLVQSTKKELRSYFEKYNKEIAIAKAIKEGYLQIQIAKYLNLSTVCISKMYKIYRAKEGLFETLKNKGIFWSYSKDISYEQAGEKLTIEYLLKYGDFDELCEGFKLFGKRVVKKVWEDKLVSDKQFIKTNLMIARVFFKMDVESSYFKEKKNARFEKLKLLAS